MRDSGCGETDIAYCHEDKGADCATPRCVPPSTPLKRCAGAFITPPHCETLLVVLAPHTVPVTISATATPEWAARVFRVTHLAM